MTSAGEGIGSQQHPTAARVWVQSALLVMALAAFFWLVHVLLNHPDEGTGDMSRTAWIGFMLPLIGLILLLMIFVRMPTRSPREYEEDLRHMPLDVSIVIGCPGCGTVFYRDSADIPDGDFQCDNCGRRGQIKHHSLRRSQIRVEACPSCGHRYEEYRQASECPECHTYNEY